MKTSFPVIELLGAALLLAAPLAAQPAPAPTAQQQAAAMTLDEAMATALAANPSLAAARLGREEVRARVDVARQRPNPDLAIEEAKDFPRDSATLSLPIERGAKRQRRIQLAEAQGRTGEAELARLLATTR
ncbi:MAG TPA: TolC family protein, partial [Thermoanaerobaculia bacterium]|nr:TolC family protein [Thermoanaerobaculia bacterium]